LTFVLDATTSQTVQLPVWLAVLVGISPIVSAFLGSWLTTRAQTRVTSGSVATSQAGEVFSAMQQLLEERAKELDRMRIDAGRIRAQCLDMEERIDELAKENLALGRTVEEARWQRRQCEEEKVQLAQENESLRLQLQKFQQSTQT
jgi:hypothetical protein